jgi:hypothetical protein
MHVRQIRERQVAGHEGQAQDRCRFEVPRMHRSILLPGSQYGKSDELCQTPSDCICLIL